MDFSGTRDAALSRLKEFIPKVKAYARDRNFVQPGNENVSCLSPAIRCRLLTESEVIQEVMAQYDLQSAEKFIQEVYWRTYWKGWLELRPQIWTQYRQEVQELKENSDLVERCQLLEEGRSGIEPLDHFAHQLNETGYMHNHARMWFASYWVHGARLPWQLGADYFYRHLLDADPASNTLSWRWVAGLQTQGKTYLVKKENIEKFARGLDLRSLDRLSDLQPVLSEPEPNEVRTPQLLPPAKTYVNGALSHPEDRIGIWFHGEDLSLETSPLKSIQPASICAICSMHLFEEYDLSESRQDYMQQAVVDGIRRAKNHFGIAPECRAEMSLSGSVIQWAKDQKLNHVTAMRPCVGPLSQAVEEIERGLAENGIQIHWFRRPEDEKVWPYAKKGFFPFWQKVRSDLDKQLQLPLLN